MSDLELTTVIACFALALGIFGFFIGVIYNTKQIKKINDRIDKEVSGFNRRLKLLNNSVYGNLENNCQGCIDNKVISKLVNEHGDRLAHISHVISMLIEHTNCDALKNYKL